MEEPGHQLAFLSEAIVPGKEVKCVEGVFLRRLKGQARHGRSQRVSVVVSWPELNPGAEAVARPMGECLPSMYKVRVLNREMVK